MTNLNINIFHNAVVTEQGSNSSLGQEITPLTETEGQCSLFLVFADNPKNTSVSRML